STGARSLAAAAPQRSKGIRQARVEELGNVKLYAIPGKFTIEEGSSPIVQFFAADEVPVRREYRLSALGQWFVHNTQLEGQFATVLMLKNDADNKLGKPLPGGQVQVMQRDSTGSLRKTGGTAMDDVALGAEFELEIGKDFDLRATRRVLKVERVV